MRVRVLTNVRENSGKGVRYPTRGFDLSETGRSLQKHFSALREMTRQRVFCRGLHAHAHAKLVVADDERVVLSSANF